MMASNKKKLRIETIQIHWIVELNSSSIESKLDTKLVEKAFNFSCEYDVGNFIF